MAKLRLEKQPPPSARRERSKNRGLYRLFTLFTTQNPLDAAKETRALKPSVEILRQLWNKFEKLKVGSEIQDALRGYCRERGYDPLAPRRHARPLAGEDRFYHVLKDKAYDRPYIRLPLDPLGDPETVKVHYGLDKRIDLSVYEA